MNYNRDAQPVAVKESFCGCEIVFKNARCGGRALTKMLCYVTVKNQLVGTVFAAVQSSNSRSNNT